MSTRTQLQSKSINELREIAEAVGVETDGLQKSKLISALMAAGGVTDDEGDSSNIDLPTVRVRTDNGDGSEPAGDSDDGPDAVIQASGIDIDGDGDSGDSFDRDDFRGNRRRRRRRGGQGGGQGGGGQGGGGQREPREYQSSYEQVPEGDLEVREGYLDILPEGYGFLRVNGYLPGDHDVYVSAGQVRKFGLRKADLVAGPIRPARAQEKFPALIRIDTVNGESSDEATRRPRFEQLTPLFPDQRLPLEVEGKANGVLTRIVDLIAPIGKGQRGLIVSPPKAGKTTVLQEIAQAITANNPECYLMVVLVDERPEEVTDMQRSVKGEVIYSTFDRPAEESIQVSELAIERAKRLVEKGSRRRDPARLDHPSRPGPQPRHSGLGTNPLRWRRLDRPLSAQALLRRRPQHRGGRVADDSRHRPGRDRLQDGRGHLRGVQGNRQHGAAPRSQAGRQADLPRHRHRSVRNPQGRAPFRSQGTGPGLEIAQGSCSPWNQERPSSC